MSSDPKPVQPAARVAVKVPQPDSLVEVRVTPPDSHFEVKVSPGSELIELLIHPGPSLIEVRIVPPGLSLEDRLEKDLPESPAPDEDEVLAGVSRAEFAALVEEEEAAEAKELLARMDDDERRRPPRDYAAPEEIKPIPAGTEEPGEDESGAGVPPEIAPAGEGLIGGEAEADEDDRKPPGAGIGIAAQKALARLSAAVTAEREALEKPAGAPAEGRPPEESPPPADSTIMVEIYDDGETPLPEASAVPLLPEDERMDLSLMETEEELLVGPVDLSALAIDLDKSRLPDADDRRVVKARPMLKVNPTNTIVSG
ncbi:MAG: hypothetical protein LBP33_00925 [Candidatus Adiutrix sp.]|jgi:hypothetical protein|nr:hypothetical protein [Candidatus Adiutrix sp.]